MNKLVFLSRPVLAAAILAGCSTVSTTQSGDTGSASGQASPRVGTATATLLPGAGSAAGAAAQPDPGLPKVGGVYYAFDSSAVDTQYLPGLKAEADYLSRHPGAQVEVVGNCDERGSPGYNLALGERRAQSVKAILMADGAGEKQVKVLSYGSEKPRLLCHEESCWKENRRSDLGTSG